MPTPEPITLTKEGNGLGSILVDGMVVCDPACVTTQVPYVEGDTMTFDAVPEPGSTLDGWKLNGILVSDSIYVLPGDTVTAIFRLLPTPTPTPTIPAPVADFTAAPIRGYAPLTVMFSNTSQGDISSHTWEFGDGQTASETSSTHIYDTTGLYDVSLTETGPGGSDTLTQSELIEVLRDNQPPVITISSPAEDAVLGSSSVQVSGTVTDDGPLVSVSVNDVLASVTGDPISDYTFTADVPYESGNQMITVIAKDDAGTFGFASRLIRVDSDGPEIDIRTPAHGQAILTLQPQVEISFSDFYSEVDTVSLQVQLADNQGTSTDVTGDLTVTEDQAQGMLGTPLNSDTVYMLTVTLADTLGNILQRSAAFYVPVDPAAMVPPEVPEHAGWVSGTVYDSSTCTEHLRHCTPLAGARVTLAVAGEGGETMPGTILTGPEGLFAFPLPETNIYWLRVEKAGYTYAQREVEVVRDHSIATDNIYLTLLDPAVSFCDDTGCHHESSDGLIQVDIPAGAIPAGQVIDVRATNFRHVEFLPGGELPPGTWETYAFNLGGDSDVEFLQPLTVTFSNDRAFEPGTEIPLGYWNQHSLTWEHHGTAVVDPTGEWLVMQVTHFSNFDPNVPVSPPGGGGSSGGSSGGGGNGGGDGGGDDGPVPCDGGIPGSCPNAAQFSGCGAEGACVIDVKSGVFQEEYVLSPVTVLGRPIAPRLRYSSRRAAPSETIDLSFAMPSEDPTVEFGEFVEVDLWIAGRKTETIAFAADLPSEETSLYRYIWDGRDMQGQLMPPDVYEYLAKIRVPYRGQYYWSLNGRFGGPPDYTKPTGVFVDVEQTFWRRGTVALNTQQTDSPLGTGWVLDGQQRLYEDEAGRILIADGRRNSEFYFPNNNLLRRARKDLSERLVWTNYGGTGTIESLETSTGLRQTIEVGGDPVNLSLSSDGNVAYAATDGYDPPGTISFVNLSMGQRFEAVPVASTPAAIALSPDESLAYVTHSDENTLVVVDLATRQSIDALEFEGAYALSDLVLSPDGAYAYVICHDDGGGPAVAAMHADYPEAGGAQVAVVDLGTLEIMTYIGVGDGPSDIVLSPTAHRAYVVNAESETVSVIDLRTFQHLADLPVGSSPQRIALSSNGSRAYVTNSGSNSVSVITLDTWAVMATIAVGNWPHGIVIAEDGSTAYVANRGDNSISVVDLGSSQEVDTIPTGSEPVEVALTVRADPGIYAMTAFESSSTLEYDGSRYTRVYSNGMRAVFNEDGTHDRTVNRRGTTTSYTYHADGSTATMAITPAGDDTPRWVWSFAYQGGKLATITDPAGRLTTFSIDGSNHLTSVTGSDDTVRRFAYDSRGLMTQESDERGHMTTHVYDHYGRITQVTTSPRAIHDVESGETEGGQETIHFTTIDANYLLINTSPAGAPDSPAPPMPTSVELQARVEYDRGSKAGTMDRWGRWLEKTDARGTTTFEWDSAGRLRQRTHPDGSCEVYSYDGSGNRLSASLLDTSQCALAPEDRDPSQGQTTRSTYEGRFNRLKSTTDPLGNVTTYIYDYEEDAGNAGNLIRIESPPVEDETGTTVTPMIHYSYNSQGQVTRVTDEQGTVTRYVYTSGSADEAFGDVNARFQEGVAPVPGLLTQLIKDDGGVNQTTTYTDFDALGHPGTVLGPGCCGNGQVTYYTYDMQGRILTTTDAQGIVTTYDYDATGNVIRKIEDYTEDGTTGRNVLTEYSYDAQGRLLRQRTEADGLLRETSYAYDENGKLASVTDSNGNTTSYTYDETDQLESVTNALNQTTSYTYTDKGQVDTVTLPNGTVVKYVYNALGQKVQEIEDESGLNLITSYTYYSDGNLQTVTDAEQHTTTYTYDALDRLKTVQDPLTQITAYRYDQAGNLRALTDAKTQTTGFVYDSLGRLQQESRPLGQTTTYAYNDAGTLSEKTDAKGQRTEYVYEPQTNLLTDIYYDANAGAQTGHVIFSHDRNGNLSGYNDGTTSAVYTYDDVGRKLRETVNYGPFSKTFSYTYYANGQKQSFSMPDGTTYSYTYNDNNDVQNIRIPGVGAVSYPSYTLSRPDSMSFPGGSQSYRYDALLRLDNIDGQHLDYAYSYDNVSNILTKTTEHGTYGYAYDDLYRLTDVDNPTLDDEAYSYDPVGNRETASNVIGPIAHNANNELMLYGNISYDYDANGNMVSKTSAAETRQYIYNVQNRLVRVEDGSGSVIAEYYYDPFGRRLWKEVDGERTYFFYADEGLVAEYDESGNELRSYGYQPDSTWATDPLWLKEGDEYSWYQNDHLGTSQELIDSDGNTVWKVQYTAFGEAQIQVETVTNNLRFPGQYYDAETGYHYNWNRYYDPIPGRYSHTDPIGFKGRDINLYAYARNNSVNASDPTGLFVEELTIGGLAIGGPPGAAAGAVIGVGLAVGGYAVCRAAGGCELPDEMPHLTFGAPPSAIGPYSEIQPRSPFFPPIPVMCDPGDVDRTHPIGTVGIPDNPDKYKGPPSPDCGFVCATCWAYLNKNVGLINAAKATVACFECWRCLAGLWD